MIPIFILLNKILWSLMFGLGIQFILLAKRIRVMEDFLLFGFTLLSMSALNSIYVWLPISYGPPPFWYLTLHRATYATGVLFAILIVELHRRLSNSPKTMPQRAFNWISMAIFLVLAVEAPFERGALFDASMTMGGETKAYLPVFLTYFLLIISLILWFLFQGLGNGGPDQRFRMRLLLYCWGILGLTMVTDLLSGRVAWFPIEISYSLIGLAVFSSAVTFLLLRNLLRVYSENVSSLGFLAHAGKSLQEALAYRQLGVATAGISHDLRNYSALLRSNSSLAKRANSNCDFHSLINSLQALSQSLPVSASRDAAAPFEILDLAVIATRCSARFSCRGIRFFIAHSSVEKTHVRGIASELERALHNLFQNSMEAGASEIRLDFRRGDDGLRISLSDNGGGIAVSSRDTEIFSSSKREKGGSGLGLMIVRSILEGHGASLRIPGGGGDGFALEILFPEYSDQVSR